MPVLRVDRPEHKLVGGALASASALLSVIFPKHAAAASKALQAASDLYSSLPKKAQEVIESPSFMEFYDPSMLMGAAGVVTRGKKMARFAPKMRGKVAQEAKAASRIFEEPTAIEKIYERSKKELVHRTTPGKFLEISRTGKLDPFKARPYSGEPRYKVSTSRVAAGAEGSKSFGSVEIYFPREALKHQVGKLKPYQWQAKPKYRTIQSVAISARELPLLTEKLAVVESFFKDDADKLIKAVNSSIDPTISNPITALDAVNEAKRGRRVLLPNAPEDVASLNTLGMRYQESEFRRSALLSRVEDAKRNYLYFSGVKGGATGSVGAHAVELEEHFLRTAWLKNTASEINVTEAMPPTWIKKRAKALAAQGFRGKFIVAGKEIPLPEVTEFKKFRGKFGTPPGVSDVKLSRGLTKPVLAEETLPSGKKKLVVMKRGSPGTFATGPFILFDKIGRAHV